MKAVVFSLGCKVNQCEGQSIITALNRGGIEATDKLEYADFYIINTCSVTAEADRKSRQTVARVLKLNPSAKVYICGCSSQNDSSVFCSKPNVRLVIGTAKKMELAEIILKDVRNGTETAYYACHNTVEPPAKQYEDNLFPYHTKTRSYIKIQDGCNNFCSYCIIPYLRGRSRSRDLNSIVAEAEKASGFTKEIVLTGVNTSAYGLDIGTDLVNLIKSLKHIPVRKRLSSLECTVITRELLDALAESGFCDHFHLSLQSGSASVLKRMNRKYTPDFYCDAVMKIRSVFAAPGITTDVIAGFGGETQSEFEETVDFIKKVGFTELHVFPYSERSGTVACKLPVIDKAVRQERANKLIKVGNELNTEFRSSLLGSYADVYAETEEDGLSVGYTSNYVKVYSPVPVGELKKVKLKKLYKEGVFAEYE